MRVVNSCWLKKYCLKSSFLLIHIFSHSWHQRNNIIVSALACRDIIKAKSFANLLCPSLQITVEVRYYNFFFLIVNPFESPWKLKWAKVVHYKIISDYDISKMKIFVISVKLNFRIPFSGPFAVIINKIYQMLFVEGFYAVWNYLIYW